MSGADVACIMARAEDISDDQAARVAPIPGDSLGPTMLNTGPKARSLKWESVSGFAGQPVPVRQWLVPRWIPSSTVTLISGDGGVGKSLCVAMLGFAITTGGSWLGQEITHGGCIIYSAEDDLDELKRRFADIADATDVDLADADRLEIVSVAGEDALLATLDRKTGNLIPTPLFAALEAKVARDHPTAVFIDTLADVCGGNENDRGQARQFIGMLRGLAIRHECAVVVLSHPSLSGLSSGTGMSGSTGWNNSVRSRLYMDRVLGDGGTEANPDARVLRNVKANYGQRGAEISLTWQNGIFVADVPETGIDRLATTSKGERVFIKLLRAMAEQGRYVSASPGPTFAPVQFAKHPDAEGCTKGAFKTAMERLFTAKRLEIGTHGTGSNERSHIAEVVGSGL